jgi:hypothetical protein
MSDIVYIRPIDGKSKIFSNAEVKEQQEVGKDSDGNPIYQEVSKGKYKGGAFPFTKQYERPLFDYFKKEFSLDMSDEELQRLVEKLKFKDADGNIITKADKTRMDDPFFNHDGLSILAKENQFELLKNNPAHQIFLAYARNSYRYHFEGEDSPQISSRVKYVIIDPQSKVKQEHNSIKSTKEAIKLLDKLTAPKAKIVGTLLTTLGITMQTDDFTVENELFKAINSDLKYNSSTLMRDKFIELCKLSTEELDLKFLIYQAFNSGYMKKTKNGITLFGETIAFEAAELDSYFNNPNNEIVKERLIEAMTKEGFIL